MRVIPARGGSKRLLRKNLLKYRGIPLLEIACRTALEAQIFDEVNVSTEDPEERAVIERVQGAQIHFQAQEKNLMSKLRNKLRVFPQRVSLKIQNIAAKSLFKQSCV